MLARASSSAMLLLLACRSAEGGAVVLAQLDDDATDYRFPVAWVKGLALRDVDVRVRCKPVSGKVDEACGRRPIR